MNIDDAPDRDLVEDVAEDGMAEERTHLAWGRSGLALMACGAVVARGLPTISRSPAAPIVGGLILALGGGIWILGWSSTRRHQRRHLAADPEAARPAPLHGHLSSIAYGTTVVGVAGILLAILGPG